jgi:hypothetical protein
LPESQNADATAVLGAFFDGNYKGTSATFELGYL